MNAKNHTFGSWAASFRPFHEPTGARAPTVSFSMREWARERCAGVSHLVVRGSSGRVNAAPRAMTKVMRPCLEEGRRVSRGWVWLGAVGMKTYIKNSHLQPSRPAIPDILKMASAIRPATAMERMLPE